jgi:hypothetical protein
MVSKQFSFRLADEVVEALEALQLEGESLNQTAQRFIVESLGLSTGSPKKLSTGLSTDVDRIEELIDKRLEIGLAEVRSQLEAQLKERLEELRGKLKAR